MRETTKLFNISIVRIRRQRRLAVSYTHPPHSQCSTGSSIPPHERFEVLTRVHIGQKSSIPEGQVPRAVPAELTRIHYSLWVFRRSSSEKPVHPDLVLHLLNGRQERVSGNYRLNANASLQGHRSRASSGPVNDYGHPPSHHCSRSSSFHTTSGHPQ
jgi:hypothetical protein